MSQAAEWRRAYRDQFRSLHKEAFQSWFETLGKAIHGPTNFQSARLAPGDGGIDGFVLSNGLVYQVYAPARMGELRDAETARKISLDFASAQSTLGCGLNAWIFVHNHPEAKLGPRSIAALSAIKAENTDLTVAVCDIDSLWELLRTLPATTLNSLFGSPSRDDQVSSVETNGLADLLRIAFTGEPVPAAIAKSAVLNLNDIASQAEALCLASKFVSTDQLSLLRTSTCICGVLDSYILSIESLLALFRATEDLSDNADTVGPSHGIAMSTEAVFIKLLTQIPSTLQPAFADVTLWSHSDISFVKLNDLRDRLCSGWRIAAKEVHHYGWLQQFQVQSLDDVTAWPCDLQAARWWAQMFVSHLESGNNIEPLSYTIAAPLLSHSTAYWLLLLDIIDLLSHPNCTPQQIHDLLALNDFVRKPLALHFFSALWEANPK